MLRSSHVVGANAANAESDDPVVGQDEGIRALLSRLGEIAAERDEAIAERDYVLKLFTDMGMALGKSVKLTLKVTKHGVEARTLFRTPDDALAAYAACRVVRGMLSFAPRPTDAAHDACCAAAAAPHLHV